MPLLWYVCQRLLSISAVLFLLVHITPPAFGIAGRPLRTTQRAKRGPVKPLRPLRPPQATLEGKRLRKNSAAAAIPSYFYQSLGGKGTAKHDEGRGGEGGRAAGGGPSPRDGQARRRRRVRRRLTLRFSSWQFFCQFWGFSNFLGLGLNFSAPNHQILTQWMISLL